MNSMYAKIHSSLIINSLRKHRKLMGYKQKDVALLMHLKDTSHISRWEKGLSLPSSNNLLKLSIIYRTFPNELYYNLLLELRHEILKREKLLLKNDVSRNTL